MGAGGIKLYPVYVTSGSVFKWHIISEEKPTDSLDLKSTALKDSHMSTYFKTGTLTDFPFSRATAHNHQNNQPAEALHPHIRTRASQRPT
jgi:hypothetical protein